MTRRTSAHATFAAARAIGAKLDREGTVTAQPAPVVRTPDPVDLEADVAPLLAAKDAAWKAYDAAAARDEECIAEGRAAIEAKAAYGLAYTAAAARLRAARRAS